ncbi:MAG: hypothetical protein Q4G69_09600 [Planctomycetia bacterium]|nr:hypothetical protein [Planctomycetia bacterium]
MKYPIIIRSIFLLILLSASPIWSAEFYVGKAVADFTPDRPVYLQGQMRTRISNKTETPVLANILALESREGSKQIDCAIFAALDVCSITVSLNQKIRDELKKALPEFDAENKLILSATHTHTSLATANSYISDRTDVMTGDEAVVFMARKIVPGIVAAWKSRVKAQFSYGLGQAVVAYNRRAVYQNGSAIMYGATNTPTFRAIEGVEDHDVNTMYFWDEKNTLLAMIINVSCPSQMVEGRSTVNADFWHPVRQMIQAKYGKEVCVLGLCGAAGDMSPRPLYQKEAESRMARLRNIDNLTEAARRIVCAVEETYPCAEKAKTPNVPLVHRFAIMDLPQQKIPKELYENFKKQAESYDKKRKEAKDKGAGGPHVLYAWTHRVVERYEAQQGVENPTYPVPVHVLRIGETALCTNPFELYTGFGIQIKARSKALQTFIVQLADNRKLGGYVPTKDAAKRGGYGAIPQSNHVGAEGGQLLVEKTLDLLNPMF